MHLPHFVSVGNWLLFRLTGKPAFNGKSYNTIVHQNKAAKVAFTSHAFDVVPAQGLDLLKKLLAASPKERIRAE